MTAAPTMTIPAGFEPVFRSSPYLDLIGPIYNKGSGAELKIGWRVEPKHTNARGGLHGGVIATLADIALGYTLATTTQPPTRLITASLTVDFVGGAEPGEWIETSSEVLKVGGRLAFANVHFWNGDQRIAGASGVFLVVSRD